VTIPIADPDTRRNDDEQRNLGRGGVMTMSTALLAAGHAPTDDRRLLLDCERGLYTTDESLMRNGH
jgi:hypothetical protein